MKGRLLTISDAGELEILLDALDVYSDYIEQACSESESKADKDDLAVLSGEIRALYHVVRGVIDDS